MSRKNIYLTILNFGGIYRQKTKMSNEKPPKKSLRGV